MYTDLPQRKTIRLKDYNYSQEGYYFVTICTQNREDLFGQVVGADSISARSEIMLNDAGNMIEKIYRNLYNLYKNIILDEYVVMPNHFHGIIQIHRADMESAPTDLSTIVQTFKRYTTIEYINGVKITYICHLINKFGNVDIINILYAMNKNYKKSDNIFKTIAQNGRRIHISPDASHLTLL